jgi:hypothetical protein
MCGKVELEQGPVSMIEYIDCQPGASQWVRARTILCALAEEQHGVTLGPRKGWWTLDKCVNEPKCSHHWCRVDIRTARSVSSTGGRLIP